MFRPDYQKYKEDRKGSLKVGKRAEFVIPSKDQTAIDWATMGQFRVEKTINGGHTICRRP